MYRHTTDREGILTMTTAQVPLEGHDARTLQNLVCMLASKQTLLQQSFGLTEPLVDTAYAEQLRQKELETLDDLVEALDPIALPCMTVDLAGGVVCLSLPGITAEQRAAWCDLVALMSEKAKEMRWALTKPAQEENPKYALRTWLLRLGMTGDAYTETRKILLDSLPGHAAYRHPLA